MVNEIPIVFATDENFVPYCGTAIYSLSVNASKSKEYRIFVLYNSLSFDSIYKLESLSVSFVTVKCICINEYVKNVDVKDYLHISTATINRLIIPKLFSQYKKVIYLDSDIIVNDDISKLYQIDVSNYYIGAFHNEPRGNIKNYLKDVLEINEECYFNAGVLVINMPLCINNCITEKCIDILNKKKDIMFMDQCALNLACKDHIKSIPCEWNYQWIRYVNCPDCNKKTEYEKGSSSSIIHYDSDIKPWNNPDLLLSLTFWKYARETIFYEQIVQNMSRNITKDIFKLVGKYNRKIVVYGAGDVGKQCVKKIIKADIGKIVLWVDKNYMNIQDTIIPVENIGKIFEVEFDRIIIAVGNFEIANEIKSFLINNSIQSDTIINYFN